MIGKIKTGKSFRGCINYCLDKKLAEVLSHNLCYGDKKELLVQFNDVRILNQKLSNPVRHMTISLSPGEKLSKEKLISIAADCATEMGFDKNQYFVVQHHDTDHEHIHIIVNRVGLNGKTLSDSNNYKKIAEFCRKMEIKHNLKKVLMPRRYLSKEQRQLPRLDERKEKLKTAIKNCIKQLKNYPQFEQSMKQHGYKIEKGRGIAFTDNKGVRIKGSEVGYSLSVIEKILSQQLGQVNKFLQKKALQGDEQKKKPELLLNKTFTGLLIKKSSDNIVDILTEKPAFEKNINHQFKKKRGQRL